MLNHAPSPAQLTAACMSLPDAEKLTLIRAMAEKLSWSFGVDDIERGCNAVEEDIRSELALEQGERVVSPWSSIQLCDAGRGL